MDYAKECLRLHGEWAGAGLLAGVSAPGPVTAGMVQSMACGPILCSAAGHAPDIMPGAARI